MPAATMTQMSLMMKLLPSGPILLGEDHEKPHARVAIRDLIDLKLVDFLSIETPIGPVSMVRSDGQLRPESVATYFQGAATMKNEMISTPELVAYAMANGVAVYCHDVPVAKSPLNYLATKGLDLTSYPAQASLYLPPSMRKLPPNNGTAADQFIQRNAYSANYLKAHLGAGVRVLFNLVILAGAFHLDPMKCRQDRTLQARLGVGDGRTFILD